MRGRRFSFEFYSLFGLDLNYPSVGHVDVRQDGDEGDSDLESSIYELNQKRGGQKIRNQSHHDKSLHVDGVGVSNPVAE